MSARSLFQLALLLATIAIGHDAVGDEPPSRKVEELTAQVDELFAKWNRLDSPGCSVGIVQRGELIYSKGFGTANLEYGIPNTPQTVIDVMSFTKSLTCACVAMLMDEGRIAPEEELRKYVPEMYAFDPPIRIQDLVQCKSGIWDQVSLPILIGCENAPLQVPLREADFFSLLAGQRTLPF
jgi:CubicO group peptidase (beta-lactamase class C family)